MNHGVRKRMIDRTQAAREGRRFYAFYRGHRDCRAGRRANPFPPGSEQAQCWDAGWKFAESQMLEAPQPPLCRFGPGGEFIQEWPETQE